MATLRIDFRTDYARDEMSHIDITLLHRSDSRLNRFTILHRIPDGDLGRGIVLYTFDDLEDGRDYTIVGRLFLNNQPFYVLRPAIFRLGNRVCSGWWIFGSCRGSNNVHTIVASRR